MILPTLLSGASLTMSAPSRAAWMPASQQAFSSFVILSVIIGHGHRVPTMIKTRGHLCGRMQKASRTDPSQAPCSESLAIATVHMLVGSPKNSAEDDRAVDTRTTLHIDIPIASIAVVLFVQYQQGGGL